MSGGDADAARGDGSGAASSDGATAGFTAGHGRRALLDAAPLQPGLLAAVYPGQYGTLPIPGTWQVLPGCSVSRHGRTIAASSATKYLGHCGDGWLGSTAALKG